MNRTILIVICDFLLVSLLAFSTVDINKVADEGSERRVQVDIATNQVDSGQDLAAVMRIALEEERKGRDQLLGELARARDSVGERERQMQNVQRDLQERDREVKSVQRDLQERAQQVQSVQRDLQEREQQVQTFKQELQAREQEAQNLQQQQAALQLQQTNLVQKFTSAQNELLTLKGQLQNSSVETVLTKEKLAALEAEAKKQSEQATALQAQLAQLATSNQMVLNEKQRLAGQLQVAEVEKRHATEQVARMQDEVKVEREEKSKLAEGVKALASKSGELAQEVRETRPLAPNNIFNEFVTNRVQARLYASRSGLFGLDASKHKETETVLVSDGTNIYSLCHIEDTPLALGNPGTDWEGLVGTLAGNVGQVPIRSLSFHWHDPRVVLMPVTAIEARQLACKVYRVSADPFKFQDAVLVGAREGYYGECGFQIDLTTPDYLKLDRNLLKGLFGKFNPSRGDLVFSKMGELLGVMVNSTYCLMLRSFTPGATVQFGQDVREQHTGETLTRLYSSMLELPSRLQ